MTVHAAPSSVFLARELWPELFLGTGALLPSEAITTVFSYWLLSCQDGHRCGVSLVINQNKHATSTNQAGTMNAKPPAGLRKAPLLRVVITSG